jgi:protein O-mannosyl-transferase
MSEHNRSASRDLQYERYKYIFYFLSFFICLGLYLISFDNGLIGDDYNWLLNAREGGKISVSDHIFSAHPFGYFRPVPVLLFRILFIFFNDSLILYRFIIIVLYFFSAVLIFHLIRSLHYGVKISFVTATLFLVLTSHADVIYSINAMNVLLSAFFIIAGLYIFSKGKDKFYLLAILMFLLALLSRESSFCFIPLLLLVNFKVHRAKWLHVLIIIIIPVIVYFIVKSFIGFNQSRLTGINSGIDIISFNPAVIAYNIVYFLVPPLFPFKTFITFIFGPGEVNQLREIILNPQENLFVFASLLLSGAILSAGLLYLAFKSLKKEIYFPLLFTLSAAVVYIPMMEMAERFLFLPSVGICLLIAMLVIKIKNKKIIIPVLLIFIILHLAAFYYTAAKYSYISDFHKQYLTNLYARLNELPEGSNILLKNPPAVFEGKLVIVNLNINEMWQYNFPSREYHFWLYEIPADKSVVIDTILAD